MNWMDNAPRRPAPPITIYDALHPILLIRRIVIDERAIPTKLADERTAFAVDLLSGGKKSATSENANGLMAELTVQSKNLKSARTKKESTTPVVS